MIAFFAFPPAVRKGIYTTSAIGHLDSQLRKIIKTRGHFPTDDAATKLLWLALRNITADWGRATRDWKQALNQSATFMRIVSGSLPCHSQPALNTEFLTPPFRRLCPGLERRADVHEGIIELACCRTCWRPFRGLIGTSLHRGMNC